MKKPSNWTRLLLLTVFLSMQAVVDAQIETNDFPAVLNIKDQVQVVQQITQKRLEQLIPPIMEQTGFDMWIIACNEDDLDPVFITMIPYQMWCPIMQIIVFYNQGNGKVERLNISRTDLSGLFTKVWDHTAWDNDKGESQWECLKKIVQERDPKKIGINIGEIQWAAGGLSVPLLNEIKQSIGKKYSERLVSAEPMVNIWGMTLLDEEVALMERAQAVSHEILAETYSSKVITPGVTTLNDLQFYYWQRVCDVGLEVGSHPKFRIKGRNPADVEKYGKNDQVIRPGDFIFCDVTTKYMRYYTDHAEWAYVLRPGETDVPENFKKLMAEGNRLQDVFCSEFKSGLTGDELLTNILNKAKAVGIPGPMIYSHSIGYYLHETGPLIGLPWEQVREPGRGDVRLQANSCFACELSVAMPLPELNGQSLAFALEEVVFFDGKKVVFLDGRQTEFYVVR